MIYIQWELLRDTYATLEDLQTVVISTNNLLFSFRKQNQGDQTTDWKPDNRPVRQGEYWPGTQSTQDMGVMGSDSNAMELDWLSADEYHKQRAGGLCC